MYPHPVGAIAPITTCPHCSVLVNGSCMVCEDGNPHPSCKDCRGGEYAPPFHRSPLFVAIFTAAIVATTSGIVLAFVNRRLAAQSSRR